MNVALLKAVRIVIRADSDPVRQALFSILKKTNVAVYAACWVRDRLGRSWASSLLVSAYGLKSLLALAAASGPKRQIVAIAVHANARQQIERFASACGPGCVGKIRTGLSAIARWATLHQFVRVLLGGRHTLTGLRVIHAVNRRHDFLVSCRVASALGCYVRARAILGAQRPRAVLVSSDSNPEEVALTAAARTLCLPTIFVSHAYTTSVSPPLNFSLSVLEGAAAVDAHLRKGPIKGDIFLGGVDGESRPMVPLRLNTARPVVGIFPPKVVAWPTLVAIIADCRRLQARQLIIRWHPSALERPRLAQLLHDTSDIVETAPTESLTDVALRCDWVIADADSNVHLPVLKLGIPTIAVASFGVLKDGFLDLYGFVGDGIIPPPVRSVGVMRASAAVGFYSDHWAERFRRYDASYLESPANMQAQFHKALRRVLGESWPSAPDAPTR
jgi:hypothetical protein